MSRTRQVFGNLLVQVWMADEQDGLSAEDVPVNCDGRDFTVKAGTIIRLTPGESITLPQYMYHTFWAEPGCGPVLSGEVSKVNDDGSEVYDWFYDVTALEADGGVFEEPVRSKDDVRSLCADPTRYEDGADFVEP